MNRRSRELPEIVLRTIPEDTRCHLWDMGSETITKDYFVTQGPLNVLVRSGYGPMYGALKWIAYGEGHDARDIARQVPFLRRLIPHGSSMDQAINALVLQYPEADAILMATSKDGKVGIMFLNEGTDPDLESLQ